MNPPLPPFFPARFVAIGLTLVLTSCDRHLPDVVEITESRPAFSDENDVPASSTSSQRLGQGSQATFKWTAPPGWKLMPSTQFRELNFSFGSAGEGECYLSITRGGIGATLQEVNRWRKQMAAEPIDDAAVQSIPKLELFKQPCPHVKLEGTYTPAGGMGVPTVAARPNYGLAGLILEIPGREVVVTVKMVGPKEMVTKEEENFKAFVNSLNRGISQ